MTRLISPPDLTWPNDGSCTYRPSWSASPVHLNEEHAAIAKHLEPCAGSLRPEESAKLYEMAYHAGAVMLGVGASGAASVIVSLRGALRAAQEKGTPIPQCYAVEAEAQAVLRASTRLRAAELDRYCLLYHGDLGRFHRDLPITPTMVFVGADPTYAGAWSVLHALGTFLAPGTPVLCHGYVGADGTAHAIDEWARSGQYELIGLFGASALLRATARCAGKACGLSPEKFHQVQNALLARYLGDGLRPDGPTPVRDLTALAREEFQQFSTRPRGHEAWPYTAPGGAPLPPTLPDGRPWPRISIVTPSYNQGRFIEETILSVANQGYPNVEHIVIDGGSTDETLEVLERHRHRLAYVVSEKDRGQSHALNKGFAQATGDILTWLNSDDHLAPGALAAMAMAFHTSGADMVAGICELRQNNVVVDEHLTSCANGILPLEDMLDLDNCWFVGQFFYQPEVFFTRSLWERAGGYVDESAHWCMDYEMWLRFGDAGAKIHVIGRTIAIFRVHADQKTAHADGFKQEGVAIRDAFLARTGRPAWSPRPGKPSKRRLRIALVNDSGFELGAGIAHARIGQALANAGHEVYTVGVTPGMGDGVGTGTVLRALEERPPDLVLVGNLHWSGVDPGLPGLISARWPTATVLHDFWPLTGRCPHPKGCTRYVEGCNHDCPTAGEYPPLPPEKIAEVFRVKRVAFDLPRPPALLACSRWARDTALRLFHRTPDLPPQAEGPAKVGLISLGLSLDVFRPRDKRVCRELLGLPPTAFIVMTGACSIKSPDKGTSHLIRALTRLNIPDLLLLLVGQGDPSDCAPLQNVRSLGFVRDPQKLALAYGAADVFVGPSLAETFGQTFMEAAACGTPSLGYPTSGVCEAIQDGVTGRLASRIDPVALSEALDEIHAYGPWRRHLGQWARLYAENEWSLAAIYHRLNRALVDVGLRDLIGMSRKISVSSQEAKLEAPHWVGAPNDGWRPVSGFGRWEGPYPQWGLPICVWTHGPQSSFEVFAERDGPHTVLIRCLNMHPNQRLRIIYDGQRVFDQDVPVSSSNADVLLLKLSLKLRAGTNLVELFPWQWSTNPVADQRSALLIVGVYRYAEPAAAEPTGCVPLLPQRAA